MKNPMFSSNQVVRIDNEEQFNEIYHVFRSSKMGESLEEWLDKGGYPSFPLYLEHANSNFNGVSIGYTYGTENTWTGEEYEVLSFEEACN